MQRPWHAASGFSAIERLTNRRERRLWCVRAAAVVGHDQGPASASGSDYRNLCWPATVKLSNMAYLLSRCLNAFDLLNDAHEAASVDITRLAQHGLAMRQWERQHLPTEGTQLGYEVFMKLAELVATDGASCQAGLLKRLYLALPYSEKGIRLHLRRLEATGWITTHKMGDEGRAVRIALSPAYWQLMHAYAAQWFAPAAAADTDISPAAPAATLGGCTADGRG